MISIAKENSQPTGTDRVSYIIEQLGKGVPREKIASEIGYSTWKSLDILMRRNNYRWDGLNRTYVRNLRDVGTDRVGLVQRDVRVDPESREDLLDSSANRTDQADEIVRLFASGLFDAKEIAQRSGFSSHRELGNYMLLHGYVWDSKLSTYTNQNGMVTNSSNIQSDSTAADSTEHVYLELLDFKGSQVLQQSADDLNRYKTLLDFLWASKEKIIRLVESYGTGQPLQIYAIPGKAKTKSIYISRQLTDLMIGFCEAHNLSQRQGFEAALVEFFMNHGYREKVQKVLMNDRSKDDC